MSTILKKFNKINKLSKSSLFDKTKTLTNIANTTIKAGVKTTQMAVKTTSAITSDIIKGTSNVNETFKEVKEDLSQSNITSDFINKEADNKQKKKDKINDTLSDLEFLMSEKDINYKQFQSKDILKTISKTIDNLEDSKQKILLKKLKTELTTKLIKSFLKSNPTEEEKKKFLKKTLNISIGKDMSKDLNKYVRKHKLKISAISINKISSIRKNQNKSMSEKVLDKLSPDNQIKAKKLIKRKTGLQKAAKSIVKKLPLGIGLVAKAGLFIVNKVQKSKRLEVEKKMKTSKGMENE